MWQLDTQYNISMDRQNIFHIYTLPAPKPITHTLIKPFFHPTVGTSQVVLLPIKIIKITIFMAQ